MKKNLNEILASVEVSVREKVLAFDILCHELQILVDRENEILLIKKTMVFDSHFVRKLRLMSHFEHQIAPVLNDVKYSCPLNIPLHAYLIDMIQNIRRSLCINTTFHMDDLKDRTARLASLKEGLTLYADIDSGRNSTACH
jgi:hypothetical protein